MQASVPMTAEQSLDRAREIVRATVSSEPSAPSIVIAVAVDIGAEIIEEHIPQGADLNSVELAKRFGTSRTPVREALMLLEKQGLVDIPPRRRPRAGMIDIARAREIFHTRAILMEALAPGIVAAASDADFDALEERASLMQDALEASDDRAFLWANTDFHLVNLSIANNHTVSWIVGALLLRSMWVRRRTLEVPGRRAESLDEHWRLLRAYRDRDAQLAGLMNRLIHLGAARALERSLR